MARFKGTEHGYGNVAVFLHWLSAVLILTMLPLGFLMQAASGTNKLKAYQIHAVIGCFILFLTLLRVIWKGVDIHPNDLPELTGVHQKGTKITHALLYVTLLALTISGTVLIVQTGMVDLLRGATPEFPNLDENGARQAHGLIAIVYMGLLAAHIGGVMIHQVRHRNALSRMSWQKTES